MSGAVGKILTTDTGVNITTETGVGLEYDAVAQIPLSPLKWQTFYTMDLLPYQSDGLGHLRASDLGYRTLPSDEGGVLVYPPLLDTAFEIDRRIGLDPTSLDGTATFGAVHLNNLPQQYDTYTESRNSDSRYIQINVGQKSYDRTRGVYVDPSSSTLFPLFTGYAMSWQLAEDEVQIPLRDVTYWADRPIQTSLYTGAGGAGGGADLTGKPIPVVRGGTPSAPVLNVALVLVDAVNLIYQYTDAAGTIVQLYEGGAAVFTLDGDVSDLWSGTVPNAGHYRTDNSHGRVQMGSKPVAQLTADVTGAFPVAGMQLTAASIAQYILTETLAQPTTTIDLASFAAADTAYPYAAGFYVGTSDVRALDILNTAANSLGGRLIAGRDGKLKLFVLRQVPSGTTPEALLTTANVISLTPQTLPKNLDPPVTVWKVGYGLNNTVQSSGLNVTVSAGRANILANSYLYVASVASIPEYPSANKPPLVPTFLLQSFDAFGLANALTNMWKRRAGYYAVEVPMDIAANLDIGDFIGLVWPLGDLRTGQVGQIVGDQIRSYDVSVTFTILVTNPGSSPFTVGVSALDGTDTL